MDCSRKNTTSLRNLVQQMTNHCPTPNLLADTFTDSAFLEHSSLLSFLSQEMSLNIDIKRIFPVKVAGVCPKLRRRSLILSQSCNVVNPGKVSLEFNRFSIDSIIIFTAFLGSDSCKPVIPSFVGFGMLKNLSEAQHRIRKYTETFVF